jgi:gas vesicle protein
MSTNLLAESGRLEDRIPATIQKESGKLSQTIAAVREETKPELRVVRTDVERTNASMNEKFVNHVSEIRHVSETLSKDTDAKLDTSATK